MTMALCFNCGEIKIGALIPCANCAQGPTKDKDLDLLFTGMTLKAYLCCAFFKGESYNYKKKDPLFSIRYPDLQSVHSQCVKSALTRSP